MGRQLLCALTFATVSLASDCAAQVPFAVLSWGPDCGGVLRNVNFAGPRSYSLWVWVKNLTPDNENVGFQIFLTCSTSIEDVPDAWRFDDAGCQTGRFASDQGGSCPSMLGTDPVGIVQVEHDATEHRMIFGYTVSYNPMIPAPGTVYTLWHLSFDHSLSVAGSDGNLATCDHVDDPVCFMIAAPNDPAFQSYLLSPSQVKTPFAFGNPPDQYASWNASANCPQAIDPTEPGTWGRVKSLYR